MALFTEVELEWLARCAKRHALDIAARPEIRDQANRALMKIHRYTRVGGFLDARWRPPADHLALIVLFCDWALAVYGDIYRDPDSDLTARLEAHQELEIARSVKRKCEIEPEEPIDNA